MSNPGEKLTEIKDQIKELIDEAYEILRRSGNKQELERAKAYWYAHIVGALDKDNDYLGGSMVTMQDAIDALWEDDEEDEIDEDEEDAEIWGSATETRKA